MEEVVLHAPDDVGEGRHVGGQYPVAIHPGEGLRGALGMAHDFHEEAARPQVGADAVVDEVAALPDEADGAGPHAPDLGVGLEQVKDLQQRHGIVAEDIRVGHLQEAADGLETAG